MDHQKVTSFHVIGIGVRTTNENGQAMKDIPLLWARFMEEQIAKKIPGKVSKELYCIYIDYEKDHTRPYTTLLGCSVKSLDNIPYGMIGKTIPEGNYAIFTVNGNLTEGAVYHQWVNIWNTPPNRSFTADFEVYGEKAGNPLNAEVDIFVAIK